MKKLFLSFFVACLLSIGSFAQLPINKPIKILSAIDKKQCLQKKDSLQLSLASYKEALNQEWKIIPSEESGFYYLQTADGYYLNLNLESTKNINPCELTTTIASTDNYKFSFNLRNSKEWNILAKLQPNNSIQSDKNGGRIQVMPIDELDTSAFVIDTIPYRRPKPAYTKFEISLCEAGLLVNDKQVVIYGADATFFRGGGLYPAQFILRIYTSADKKDRINMLIFDDIIKLRKSKTYLVTEVGDKKQPNITLYKNEKGISRLNQAIIKLEITNQSTNSFELSVESAKKIDKIKSLNSSTKVYDIAIKGKYRLQ